jgi:hypothetical protein
LIRPEDDRRRPGLFRQRDCLILRERLPGLIGRAGFDAGEILPRQFGDERLLHGVSDPRLGRFFRQLDQRQHEDARPLLGRAGGRPGCRLGRDGSAARQGGQGEQDDGQDRSHRT